MLKQYLTTVIIACISLTQVFAQDQQRLADLYDFPPAQEGDLLCRCVSTFLPKNNETFYFYIDDAYREVALVGEGISMAFPVRGTNTFTLYSKSLSKEGKPIYTPVVQQVLNGSGGNYLIILSRPKNTTSLEAKTYNINTDKYPADSLYLFNESPVSLGVQVDKVNAVVKPFESHVHDFKDMSGDKYTSAKIAIAYKGEAKIMSSKRLRIIPGRRVMMICFPSINRAKMGATPLRVITLQDMPKS